MSDDLTPADSADWVAGAAGIEPAITGSKPGALPLGYAPIVAGQLGINIQMHAVQPLEPPSGPVYRQSSSPLRTQMKSASLKSVDRSPATPLAGPGKRGYIPSKGAECSAAW